MFVGGILTLTIAVKSTKFGGMLNPLRDKHRGIHVGGGRDGTCVHDLSGRSQRFKKKNASCELSWNAHVCWLCGVTH